MDYFIDFLLLALIYNIFFYKKWKRELKWALTIKTLMYLYVVLVLFVTLMPFTMPFSGMNKGFMETANFIPFRDLRLKYDGAIREIVLNILMMVPFGFLYPSITKKGMLKTVVTTLFFSLAIESYQLLSVWWNGIETRIFDVTDLITNTSGGLIGYLTFVILRAVVIK
ncbi:glycopeptide antibiotics resistance protein [Ureibacillus xyleni]|uniref:Glycopeptide antibiotics resistance protein n=1 Tax=Ureibacillus xyleni TaxID=614648 RepID=A0A285THT6_9BACL|nr:VanZ family protein [Ureibacillus xyleni]SOC21814.1 glycopeptide antibiotics resistance protein [Ureibacillus xyleni]